MGDITEQFGPGGWQFTPEVADVFDEHVRASVPHYHVFQQLVAAAADWLLPDGGVYADLGASTGTTLAMIRQRHPTRAFTAHLYDDQQAMLDQAKAKLDGSGTTFYHCVKVEHGPYQHKWADLTTCLFTLQFMSMPARAATLKRARQSADDWCGVLLVAEKVRPANSLWAEIGMDLSHDWKAENGIGAEAIRAKSLQLRGVLRPVDLDTLSSMLETAGWETPEVIFKWHNWVLLGCSAATR